VAALLLAGVAFAQDPFAATVAKVNQRMVKLFGSGGFKGVASYGTGIVVSPRGHVLTVAAPMLDSQNVRVHLADGRRFDNVKVIAQEPLLDLALLKIPLDEKEQLPYFDVSEAAKRQPGQVGDFVLAFSNQFQIATRDEPMTVQRGVVAAYSRLQGRRGVHEAPYTGDVYVVDMICNNPGAAGGALVTRKGELLGIVGKELKNNLTDTWINYAVPVQGRVEVQEKEAKKTISLVDFVTKGMKGEWKQAEPVVVKGARSFHGMVLVPDVVDRTKTDVDKVMAGSPAAKAGVHPDDLVVYINGEQVGYIKVFNEIMSKLGPGSRITVEVRRGDKLKTIEMELKEPLAKQ
jgi:serine protease Do